MQVDPIKPTLKASGAKRLTLKHAKPLSSFAFKFELRRYNLEGEVRGARARFADGRARLPPPLHFSSQHHHFLVAKAAAFVHFSAKPRPFRLLISPSLAHSCSWI